MKNLTCILLFLMVSLGSPVIWAGDVLDQFQEKISRFTLDNGIPFLVAERHRAPVASFVTFVNIGGVDESNGHSGIAHFLEHMAFKGTPEIGTRNWEKENALLNKVDQAYADWLRAEYRPEEYSRQKAHELRVEFERLRDKAGEYVVPNAYTKILEKNGATDLNAGTSKDYTMYFCSLPANRTELWFSLESARLRNPVFRQFFTEKQVVLEERRMRVDSDPAGRMAEELLAMAYMAHPYGIPAVGWPTDIITTTRPDMHAFYKQHYIPSNITVAIAGDVEPGRIRELAETYFGPMEPGRAEKDIITREPEQRSERRFTQTGPDQPVYMEAYHSVDRLHRDAKPLDILAGILSRGRVSRLHQQLVVKQGLAQTVQVMDGIPGDKYPGLFVIYAVPRKGVSLEKMVEALHGELFRIAGDGVSNEELQRAKTRRRADLIRGLKSNLGLARKLAEAEAQMGGWQQLFTMLEEYEQVTAEDVRTVAGKYLAPENRTSGRLLLQESGKGEK